MANRDNSRIAIIAFFTLVGGPVIGICIAGFVSLFRTSPAPMWTMFVVGVILAAPLFKGIVDRRAAIKRHLSIPMKWGVVAVTLFLGLCGYGAYSKEVSVSNPLKNLFYALVYATVSTPAEVIVNFLESKRKQRA